MTEINEFKQFYADFNKKKFTSIQHCYLREVQYLNFLRK